MVSLTKKTKTHQEIWAVLLAVLLALYGNVCLVGIPEEAWAELVPRVGWGMAYVGGIAPLWESHLRHSAPLRTVPGILRSRTAHSGRALGMTPSTQFTHLCLN